MVLHKGQSTSRAVPNGQGGGRCSSGTRRNRSNDSKGKTMFSLTSAIFLMIGFIATPLGFFMFLNAKKGEQNTLGGVIFIIGLICIGLGWWGL